MKLPKMWYQSSQHKSGVEHSNRRSYAALAWILDSNPLKWFEWDVGTEIVALTSSPSDQKRKCCSQWPYCYPLKRHVSLLFLILVWDWNIQFSPIPGTSLPLISCLHKSRRLFKLRPSASRVPLHIHSPLLSFPLSPSLLAPAASHAMFFWKETLVNKQNAFLYWKMTSFSIYVQLTCWVRWGYLCHCHACTVWNYSQ